MTGGGLDPESTIEDVLGSEEAGVVLAARHFDADRLRREVLTAVRLEAPSARVTLHGHPDPWTTGPSPALTDSAADQVDAVLVSAWPGTADTVSVVERTRAKVGGGVAVGAYVSVLPPKKLDEIGDHVAAAVGAGADELHLYHLGLVNRAQLDALGSIIAEYSR